VNESEGILYFNKECLEELFWWLQLPGLVESLEAGRVDPKTLLSVKARHSTELAKAAHAGYRLKNYLALFEDQTPDAKTGSKLAEKADSVKPSPSQLESRGTSVAAVEESADAEVEEQVREVEE
jgi:hypothetical protein